MPNSPLDDFMSRILRVASDRVLDENPEYADVVISKWEGMAVARVPLDDLPTPVEPLPKWWTDYLEQLLDLYIDCWAYERLVYNAAEIGDSLDGSQASEVVLISVRQSLVINAHSVADKARICGRVAINRLGKGHPDRKLIRSWMETSFSELIEVVEDLRNVWLHGQSAGGHSRPAARHMTDIGWEIGLVMGPMEWFDSIVNGPHNHSSNSHFLSSPAIPTGGRVFLANVGGILSGVAGRLDLPRTDLIQ
jgi:hypothetical protein